MTKSKSLRPIIVSLTAIPSRFPNLRHKINSLLNQSIPADGIEVYIPKSYRRFPEVIVSLPQLPEGVKIIQVDQDLGPATKLLPALEKWKGQDVDILICDDDRLQDRNWIKRFVDARIKRPNDIICERGWNIDERFDFVRSLPIEPRARVKSNQGKNFFYRIKRGLSLLSYRPAITIYETEGYVDVFEGFQGALIPSGALPCQAWNIPDILWTVDDVWLSGMAHLNGVGVWLHNYPHRFYRDGHWDSVDALKNFIHAGVNRQNADRMCVEYMRTNHGVWV